MMIRNTVLPLHFFVFREFVFMNESSNACTRGAQKLLPFFFFFLQFTVCSTREMEPQPAHRDYRLAFIPQRRGLQRLRQLQKTGATDRSVMPYKPTE